MKKLTGILAASMMTLALASCGGDAAGKVQNLKGGSKDEQQAIQDCISKKSVALLSGSSSMLPGSTYDLLGDNGDYVKLTTKQSMRINGKAYTVNLNWGVDTSSEYVADFVHDADGLHDMAFFNYAGLGGADGFYEIKLSSVSCGEAKSEDTGISVKANLKAQTIYHKDVKISDLTKLKAISSGYGYDVVDYTTNPTNAYYYKNPENAGNDNAKYFYVNVAGKVIYNAPDGNWGLIADGDDIMEIYAGSALNVSPSRYPAMNNSYVKVVGNMSQYNGNMQVGFMTDMKKASASDLNKEPTLNYAPVSADDVKYISREDGTHYQCVYGANLVNALKSITGKYVAGSLKGSDGKAIAKSGLSSDARFTFDMSLGKDSSGTERIVTVAYDYHTDKDGSVGLFNKLSGVIDSTNEVTIKGTLRFTGNDSAPFNQTGGYWQLAPFLADHVA